MTTAPLKLPRLTTNWQVQPQLFERYFNDAMTEIETAINAVLALPEIQADLAAAEAAAVAATAAAATATSAANTATTATATQAAETSIVNSYVTNFTPPLLSCTSGGVVTIANHDRVYGNMTLNPTVHVTGGTVTSGGTSGQTVRIFYHDTSRTGGVVSYFFTIDPAIPPAQSGNVHSVGAAVVPASGSADGFPLSPPGTVNTQ